MTGDDIKALIAKNPRVDETQVREAQCQVKALRKLGVKRHEYDIASPRGARINRSSSEKQ